MIEQNLPQEIVVFVCTNQRAEGERVCCAGRGGVELHARLKEMVHAKGLKRRVRVSKSGCMDRCEDGPNVMVFPACRWYAGVGPEDLEALVRGVEAKLKIEEAAGD